MNLHSLLPALIALATLFVALHLVALCLLVFWFLPKVHRDYKRHEERARLMKDTTARSARLGAFLL